MTTFVKNNIYNYERNNKEEIIMNFAAYIERQKNIIRNRHVGELFLIENGETVNLYERERLLEDLASLKGLNKRERLGQSYKTFA